MIKEAYCSLEVAKLLEEKGFNKDYPKGDCTQIACTHQMATAWLREIHNYHIFIILHNKKFMWRIKHIKKFELEYGGGGFKTNEEAVDSALKFALKHLI